MHEVIKGFDGFLWIGDVHAASHRPGRRLDDYASACIDKLSQAAKIARERRLYPVCLGDLFHRARENNLEFLARMMTVCREFEVPMIVLAGSHDRTETTLTSKDAAQLLESAGCIRVIDKPGKVLTLECDSKLVSLWATPAGCRIPDSVDAGTDRNIMITHHELSFNGYPEAIELKEIENCDLLVNGHLHNPAPMQILGRTAYHNPGSIMRVAVDEKKHKPVVSAWTPAHGISLESVPLVFAENVFDLTGKEVYAADPRALKAELPKGLRLSSFAGKLRGATDLEASRTDDGTVLVEQLDGYFKAFDKPDNLKRYMTGLLADVIREQHGIDVRH